MAARQSAAVYRRRRFVFFAAIVLVLGVLASAVWLFAVRPWESVSVPEAATSEPSDASTPADSDTSTDTPTPDSSETPGVVACEASDILVLAVTDAETYAEGELPKLSISLTNSGAQDCTLDVGTSTQKLVVTSGDDTWWSSTDCQENPSSQIATIKAGETVTSAEPVVWDRTRSSVDTCDDENRPRATAGGASYHVAVSIGGFDSTATKQIVLN